jgi:hypothetical protein
MSWTIEHNQGQNDTAIEDLKKAIEEAKRAGIIMLCSASDRGSDFKESLPSSTGACIRIGAGTENGDKCSWVHKEEFDFCFPGENVPLKTSKDGPVKMYNGSSVATAVAAGSVGLLLYLNKLNAKGRKMSVENKRSNDLKNAMKKTLESMCKTSKSTHSRCPKFGDTFGGEFNEFMFMLDRDTFYLKLGQIMDGLKVLRPPS